MSDARVRRLVVGDHPAVWSAAGFTVGDDGTVAVGSVAIEPNAGGGRFERWEVAGIETIELDGLETAISEDAAAEPAAHPNGVESVDHVVAFSPNLDRTVGVLEKAGFSLRRIREEPTPAGAPRQAFFRLGEVILEVVQQPPEMAGFDPSAPARLWGLAFVCSDLDALAEQLGDKVKGPREAVQPGRRIATLTREAGFAVPIAFMTPGPGAA
jgi:hypothetical protein